MARPPRFDESVLLDAALQLAAESGPAAVTMAAVARTAGAPNGSVYHRFPQRSVLLAELWLRTVTAFQEGFHAILASNPDPRTAGAAAARHVVAWCRAEPDSATVLLWGPEAFGRADWPDEHVQRADGGNRSAFRALKDLAEQLGATDPEAVDRVVAAVVDLPTSVVRRYLRTGRPLPAHAEDLVERCAADLLAKVSTDVSTP